MQVDGSPMSKPVEANPFLLKVVHGVRQDVSVSHTASILRAEFFYSDMNNLLASAFVLDSQNLVCSRASSISTYSVHASKLRLDVPLPQFDPVVPTPQTPVPRRAVLRCRFHVRCILWSFGVRYIVHERHGWEVGMVLDLCAFGSNICRKIVLTRSRSWRDARQFASESSPPSV